MLLHQASALQNTSAFSSEWEWTNTGYCPNRHLFKSRKKYASIYLLWYCTCPTISHL